MEYKGCPKSEAFTFEGSHLQDVLTNLHEFWYISTMFCYVCMYRNLYLLVPDRSNAAGLLPWMPVVNAVRTVRCAARVGAWPTAVRALHRRAGADRRAPRPTSTHVRRRLPGEPQHVR